MFRFNKHGLYAVNFFRKGLERTVVVAAYSPAEQDELQAISSIVPYNTVTITNWCRRNGHKFHILTY